MVRRDDFEGCSFINVLLELGAGHPVCTASATPREHPLVLGDLAQAAGVADPDAFARTWHILMKGSIVAAMEGDTGAAQRVKSVARLVLAQHTYSRAKPRPGNICTLVADFERWELAAGALYRQRPGVS